MINREEERKLLLDSCPEPPAERESPSPDSGQAAMTTPRPSLDWTQPEAAPPNAPPQVFHPWRRYLARTMDVSLYGLLVSAILGLVFRVNLMDESILETWLSHFASLLIMFLVEPFLLHWLGTTPGKALFGLRVTWTDGTRLTLREARARTIGVLGAGMGYGIPIYNLYRGWKSYQLCSRQKVQPWDEGLSYTIRDTKPLRGVAFVMAFLALIFLNAVLLLSQQLPPNRGDLTVAEFSENHQYYARYFNMDLGGRRLNRDGQWVNVSRYDSAFGVNLTDQEPPVYDYTVEAGVLTSVSFVVEIKDNLNFILPYQYDMGLITMAFLGARKEVGLFSSDLTRAVETIAQDPFGSFQFTVGGVVISCDTTCTGFETSAFQVLLPKEDAASTYFRQVFRIQNQ